ncbi:MAG: hypothetical protein V4808_12500 [Pseudomonadota bacterium]
MAKQTKLIPQKPTHRIYCVEGEGNTARWTEIGAAWPHKDGKGHAISCAAIPLQGRIVMREITERPAAAAA